MILRTPLLLLSLVSFLTACSTYTGPPPSVRLVDVALGDISLFETSLQVQTRIQNESPDPLRLSGAVHEVTLNGVYIGKAVNNEALTIPPLDSRIQNATFRVSNLNVLARVQELLKKDRLDYSLDSKLYLGSGTFGRSIKLSEKGTLFQ